MDSDPIPAFKRALGAELVRELDRYHPDDAAYLIESDRSRVADIRRGRLTRFSLETLIRYVERLGYRVELRVEPVRR